MPRNPILSLAIGASILAAAAPSSSAALLLYYNFDNDTFTENGIRNLAPGATVNGTLVQGTNALALSSFVSSGANGGQNAGLALSFQEPAGGANGTGADYIDTNFITSALGIAGNREYTAMAWVNFANQTEDNMIFGAPVSGSAALHLGSRGTQYHSGHWADDLSAGTTTLNTWRHVAFTNTVDGVQEIFVDGTSVGVREPGTGSGMNTALKLAIGTSSTNQAAFSGIMDEVKVYDNKLSQQDIQAAMVVVPEPSTFAALLGGAAMLGLRRRRSVSV